MPVLGYWDIRGLAEPIRFLLLYKNVSFEDKRYIIGEDEWKNDKFSLGLDFPNLPYYIDGDIKLTQSTTILRYLAKKHGLDGKSEEDNLRLALAEQQAVDLRWGLIRHVLRDDLEAAKPEFLKTVVQHLKMWETFLGDGDYVAGDYISYVDFLLYEVFDFYRLYEPSLCKDFPTLRAYHDRIRSLPQLQDYLKGPTYKSWPIFGPIVKWGGGGEEPKHSCCKA